MSYRKGDSFFLAAGSGDWQIEGKCDALLTTIREKASPIRVGITIGSSETQIGLVNDRNQIIAQHTFTTDSEKKAETFIDEVAQSTLDLLEEQNVPLDQCIGVGVGVPGTIDRRKGKVLYSNNLRWDNVDLVEVLGRVIPCPVRIANDADCAALGEAVAGAGKDYSDVVMFTLGGGVGGCGEAPRGGREEASVRVPERCGRGGPDRTEGQGNAQPVPASRRRTAVSGGEDRGVGRTSHSARDVGTASDRRR